MSKVKEFCGKLMSNPLAKKMFLFTGGFLVIIIFVMVIASCAGKNRTYTYTELEDKMVDIAKKYYTEKSYLPEEDGGVTEIELSTMVAKEQLGIITEITKTGKNCDGKVTIVNNNGKYLYMPYLDCDDDYSTRTLFNVLTSDDNIVTEGNGLYETGAEYIFKGDNINNYVKIGDFTFRIIRINEDDNIRMIDVKRRSSSVWDDRYNIEQDRDVGINDFFKNGIESKVSEYLNDLFKTDEYYNESVKVYFKTNDLCVGKRTYQEKNNTGTVECSTVYENAKLGLPYLSEFFQASLDKNCLDIESPSCANYNYFTEFGTVWTLTAVECNSFEAYKISGNHVEAAKASSSAGIYPVIIVDGGLVVEDGDGSENKPYIIKSYEK